MADQPDNLVLQILRDIRATQTSDSQRLGRVEQQLVDVEKQIKSINTKTTYLMGIFTDADFKAQTALDQSDVLLTKIDAVIARVEALEAR